MSGSATFTTRRAPGSGRSADAGGRRPRWTPGRIALLVVALLLTAAWLLPLAWAVATSLKPEGDTTRTPFSWTGSRVTFDAYSKVWESGDLMVWLMNSAYISVMTTLLTVVTCAMAAYGFTRTDFRGRRLLYGLVLAGIMVPPQVLIAPLFREMVQIGRAHV